MEENLWHHYCDSLDKNFKEQVQWNKDYLNDYLEEWKTTRMAKQLCPDGVSGMNGIPLTSYSDYTILHAFGTRMNELEKKIPRKKGENFCEYYDTLSKMVIDMLDGWMVDTYSFSVKTSGTTSESKWVVHSDFFWKNMINAVMAAAIISCCDDYGTTSLRKGDIQFGIGSPAPYIGGYVRKLFEQEGIIVMPPSALVDEESNFMNKINIALKYAKQLKKIDIIGTTGSIFKMIALYFSDMAELFKQNYTITPPGIRKLILWILWKYKKYFGKKLNKLKCILNPKGLFMGSFDTELYREFIIEQLEIEPCNLYGSTECGFPLYGRPGRKSDLIPDLRGGYFEFLDRHSEIRKIDELERGGVYELVYTPFRSIIMRYKTGDLFRVIDFQHDNKPIFCFESRVVNVLDINNYFRLSLSLAFKAFKRAGFPPSTNWAFTKEIEPVECMILLMEKGSDMSEKQVSERLFDALKKEDVFFRNYITDFKIRNPWDVIRVEYVKRGVFKRYVEKKVQEGVPLGRIKPAMIIPPENKDMIDFLKN
ncbi:MAG: GH3 auxin-responsive promoter family protein [Spirochaetales bacterium]|nr:GH3 auxin-responsive promoter family protein [Spirochaetales bacterium]